MPDTQVAGLILAAGAATRMGTPKQLLPLDGRPLLQHVLDAAEASTLCGVVVVLGAEATQVRAAVTAGPRVRFVVNARFAEGQATSLRAGLEAVPEAAAAVAVLMADQPGVTTALIDHVVASYAGAGGIIVRPVFGPDRIPGHPVILDRAAWPAARALGDDEGARALFGAHAEWLRDLPIDAEPLPDIDTPADYEAALAKAPPR
jgi:molybdenum cofactor cytidylyltransferase